MSSIRKLLVLGHVWPEPDASAAGQRVLDLLRLSLAAGWQTSFATSTAHSGYPVDLDALGIDSRQIQLNAASFDAFIAELQPDVVIFDRFMTEEQFGWRVAETCPQALRVLDTEDLHALRLARADAVAASASGRISPCSLAESYALMAATPHSYREIGALLRSDLSLVVSSFEMDLLQQHFGIDPTLLHHCPLMLDLADLHLPDRAGRQDFVCIGHFRHPPNRDATHWLRDSIWPQIRQHLPNATMHVYGAYPQPQTDALHAPADGFLIDGWAPASAPVLRRARVCLAPLRFGAGIKGKLLQAMLNGTPSVTTAIGAEGIAPSAQWPGVLADTAAELAAAAVRLHEDERLWEDCQQRIPGCLQRFDRRRLGAELIARIEAAHLALAENRQRNFIGRMLQHHRFHSTRYMSKWIEAKNRAQATPTANA